MDVKAPPGLGIKLFMAGSRPGSWRQEQEVKEAEGTRGLDDLQGSMGVFDVSTTSPGLENRALHDYPLLHSKRYL